ncbi:MAG: acyl-CoA dehydrogenase family protein [Candidatus Geothermarchaeales archaeon]
MDFDLTSEQKLIQQTAREIAQRELAPKAADVDRDATFPWDGIRKLAEAGIMGAAVPTAYGGAGVDVLSFVLTIEEIAKACASTALITVSHAAVCESILVGGNKAQKEMFLPPLTRGEKLGSFAVHEANSGVIASAIETTAVVQGDDYVVNGSKIFNTGGGEAECYLVLVRTDRSKGPQGISTLIIEKGTPGFSFGEKDVRMGFNGVSSRELVFQDCRVPMENLLGQEGGGLQIVAQAIVGFAFFGAAAISLGIAQAALDASIKHGKERIIAGRPIGTHQGIQYLLAEMGVSIDAARSLLYWTTSKRDNALSRRLIDAMKAKLYASEMAIDVASKALQIHGGHGYCRELPIERYFRDARGLTLHFKTSELLKEDIGKMLMGL